MEYKLIDLILEKAEKSVGKDQLHKVIKKIKLLPDYTLEDVACDLKLQAFDAVNIIRFIRKDAEKIPTASFFEESFWIKKIKSEYRLKDMNEEILKNEFLTESYIERIKFIVQIMGDMLNSGKIKMSKVVEYAFNFFVQKYMNFLDVVRSLFSNLMDFVKSIIQNFIGYLKYLIEKLIYTGMITYG